MTGRDADLAGQLLAAAERSMPLFAAAATTVFQATDAVGIDGALARCVAAAYDRKAFVLIHLPDCWPAEMALDHLATALRLGDPFQPPLYQGMDAGRRYAEVAAQHDVTHPSFNRNGPLALHCDGTLQPLGMVKSSALFCEMKAMEGGETILFNAVAAYAALLADDPPAALAMAHPTVRIRTANVNGSSERLVGPGFAIEEGRLLCGYTVSETDRWVCDDGRDRQALDRALEFFAAASREGSPWRLQFTLAPNTVMLLDNTRLSHGRTAFRDSSNTSRCLYRGLYLNHPTAARAVP